MVPGHFNIYQDLILVYVVHWFHLHDALEVVWSVQNFPRVPVHYAVRSYVCLPIHCDLRSCSCGDKASPTSKHM
jgi:hypothetical protein